MIQRATTRERSAPRRRLLVAGSVAVLLAFGLGLLILVRPLELQELDAEWMDEILELRGPWLEPPALAMNFLGGGWFAIFFIPLALALVLALMRRKWSAVYLLVASMLSAAVVQLLKQLLGRARPEHMLVHVDLGSFPSGHVANAATLTVALALIVNRTWMWAVAAGWVLLMMLSRTYLGVHWLTDTVGGVLLGAGIAVLIWAPFAVNLAKEWIREAQSANVTP